MQKSSEARDDVEEGLEDEEEEGPIPLDDGPVEDEVLDDMDGDDVGFGLLFTFIIFSDAPTKGQTGLVFANATTRDVHIKVNNHTIYWNIRAAV